jgi:hypothetical protein
MCSLPRAFADAGWAPQPSLRQWGLTSAVTVVVVGVAVAVAVVASVVADNKRPRVEAPRPAAVPCYSSRGSSKSDDGGSRSSHRSSPGISQGNEDDESGIDAGGIIAAAAAGALPLSSAFLEIDDGGAAPPLVRLKCELQAVQRQQRALEVRASSLTSAFRGLENEHEHAEPRPPCDGHASPSRAVSGTDYQPSLAVSKPRPLDEFKTTAQLPFCFAASSAAAVGAV